VLLDYYIFEVRLLSTFSVEWRKVVEIVFFKLPLPVALNTALSLSFDKSLGKDGISIVVERSVDDFRHPSESLCPLLRQIPSFFGTWVTSCLDREL